MVFTIRNSFKKGYIPWNKGMKMSPSFCKKVSEAGIGRKRSPEFCKKMSLIRTGEGNPMFGTKLSKERKEQISKISTGNRYRRGKKWSKESIEKRRKSQSGDKHYNWQGGISPINQRIRHSLEYKLWRESVFKRDNYTCIWCKQHGGLLHADHIKPFALFPELRFAIDNGRTLCVECHKKTDTYGYKTRKCKL